MQHSAVLIAGATASGKSALAVEIAARLGGLVVNADAMQVYRELDVLTARPQAGELARASHYLYGHVPAARRYSAGAWLEDLAAVLAEARGAGRLPVIVGGTGLYFKAATEGLVSVPPVPTTIRTAIAARLAAEGSAALHGELARHDPQGAAAIRPSDRARVTRALEVVTATGRPLWAFREASSAPPLVDAGRALKIVVEVEPAVLGERIAARVRAMVENGAIGEALALERQGLDPDLPAMKAIGVRSLAAAGGGEIALGEAIERMVVDTRRYAKRQRTWFRHQIEGWHRVDGLAPAAASAARFVGEA